VRRRRDGWHGLVDGPDKTAEPADREVAGLQHDEEAAPAQLRLSSGMYLRSFSPV